MSSHVSGVYEIQGLIPAKGRGRGRYGEVTLSVPPEFIGKPVRIRVELLPEESP